MSLKGLKSKKLKKLILFMFPLLLISCGPKFPPEAEQKIEVGDSFYYWESTAESNPGDAMRNIRNFKKLEDKSVTNLQKTLGKGEHYVWIKFDFTIPEYFRGKSLMLVIPHLKVAEQLWLNGNFISQSGTFPPRTQSSLFKSHFFSFPINLLNNEPGAINTVLIKVYALGKSGISSHSYIKPPQFAFQEQEIINFHHAKIYMLLVGTLALSFILYICLYLSIPKFKQYRDFAFMNLSMVFFLIPFFATEIPVYNSGAFPFLLFTKFTYCIPAFLTATFLVSFAFNFMDTKQPLWLIISRIGILLTQIIITLAIPTYDKLVEFAPSLLALLILNVGVAVVLVIINLSNPEKRKQAMLFTLGFLPLFLTMLIDIIRRVHDHTQTYTFISLFGWLFSTIIFIVTISIRFAKTYASNERLSNHLQDEVNNRTRELQDANYELSLLNERLEKDKFRADMDLQMASLVQQRFFPRPEKHFKGWEISIFYNPQAIVSGDLYDYYGYNDVLNGLSVFDVSGHGISASLVTMLSKNIISHAFQTGYREKQSMDYILHKINNTILYEKGDIDNYMTGLLCRFGKTDKNGRCHVEIGNAGHPYPLKYSLEADEVSEIKGDSSKKHYGAIGMKGIAVSFATSVFDMNEGDVLICYTDGLTETTNKKQEQFGTTIIKSILKENHNKPATEIIRNITYELIKFSGGKPPEDDITIIVARKTNPKDFVPDTESDEGFMIRPMEEELEMLNSAE